MTGACMSCGRSVPMEMLDGKPKRGNFTREELQAAADRGVDFDWLEGPCCYGNGYIALHDGGNP